MNRETYKGDSARCVVVSLGDLYASPCRVCGCMGYYGRSSMIGHKGCQDAVRRGEVYCGVHIHNALEHLPGGKAGSGGSAGCKEDSE